MNSEDREFQETLDLLREAHREPIGEAHYAAVRARVLSELAVRRPWWRGNWGYGFAAVALAVVLIMPHGPRPHMVGQAVSPAGPAQAQARQVAPPVVIEKSPGRRKRMSHRSAFQVVGPRAPQPLVVKLVTSDPNIVIYWISGE